MEELAKEILEEYASAYSQFDLETLAKKLEEIKQTTAQEISDLVYELIRVIESESGIDIVQKSYYKASLVLLLTKINERYGV